MSSVFTQLGAGLIGVGITLIGAGIYIKKYHENSKEDNIELKCQQPEQILAKKPIEIPNLKTTSPLFTSTGNYANTQRLNRQLQEANPKDHLLQENPLQEKLLLRGSPPLQSQLWQNQTPPYQPLSDLGLPVLHDFAKLSDPAQTAMNTLIQRANHEDNSALSAPLNLEESDVEAPSVKDLDNTILLMADMKTKKSD